MKNINITVENKRAAVVGSPIITCGNSDYTVTFAFDDDWSVTGVKTARFVYVKGGKVMHEDKVFDGNTVAVPVLSDVAFVNVGVFAGDLCTTTPARVNCRASILCGSGAVHEPTPDVYNQIMALFNDLVEKGLGGATEEQARQIEQNKKDIEALTDGTKKAGKASEAETLGGHGADHFLPKTGGTVANATNIPLIISNTTEGATQTRIPLQAGGVNLGAFAFNGVDKPAVVLTGGFFKNLLHEGNVGDYALPIDGSKRIEAPNASVFKANNANGANAYIGLYGSGSYIGGIGFTGNADYDLEVLNKNGSGGKKVLHAGNFSNYALPKDGGGTQPTLSTNHPQVLSLDNVGENSTTLLVFKHKGAVKGRFGTNWEGAPVYQNAEGANYKFLHTGNSAAVHIGTAAPSDTSALWVDTSA